MNEFRKTTVYIAAVFLLLYGIGIFCACGNVSSDDLLVYTKAPFSADLKGYIDERPIEASVYYAPASEKAEEKTVILSVSYRVPESLCGMTVTYFSNGTVRARLGEMETDGDFENLILPFFVLCPEGPYKTIEKKQGESRLNFEREEGSLTYFFDDVKLLSRVSGEWNDTKLDLFILSLKQFD